EDWKIFTRDWRGAAAGQHSLVAFAAQLFTGVDIHQGHAVAPDATGIQRVDTGFGYLALQCCPVTEGDLYFGVAARQCEPGPVAVGRPSGTFLGLEVQGAVGSAETHAGEVVGDHAEPGGALQAVAPARRFIT